MIEKLTIIIENVLLSLKYAKFPPKKLLQADPWFQLHQPYRSIMLDPKY